MKILALDIGATKIALAQLDEEHTIQERRQIPSNFESDLWQDLADILQKFEADRIGIASAGPINVLTGTISPVNIPHWRNFPIVQELAALFGHHSIDFNSDTRCDCGRIGCLETFARGLRRWSTHEVWVGTRVRIS